MEDLNLASIQSYKIEVNYTKNKVLNYINFVGENGATAMGQWIGLWPVDRQWDNLILHCLSWFQER